MEFPMLFPGTTMYKLEENYRSTQPILNLANCIIEEATEKYTKHLFTRKTRWAVAGVGGGGRGECAVAIHRAEDS